MKELNNIEIKNFKHNWLLAALPELQRYKNTIAWRKVIKRVTVDLKVANANVENKERKQNLWKNRIQINKDECIVFQYKFIEHNNTVWNMPEYGFSLAHIFPYKDRVFVLFVCFQHQHLLL